MEEADFMGFGNGEDWLDPKTFQGKGKASDALLEEHAGHICTEAKMNVDEEKEPVAKVRARCQGPQMTAKGILNSAGRHLRTLFSQGMGTE